MVRNLVIEEMKDMNICQLLVDELRIALTKYRKAKAKNKAVPVCTMAPLLIYILTVATKSTFLKLT